MCFKDQDIKYMYGKCFLSNHIIFRCVKSCSEI